MNQLKTLVATSSLWTSCFALCFGVAFHSSNSQAATITNGCADNNFCTLAELSSGGSIQINGVLYDDWTVLRNSTPFGSVNLNNIQIQEIEGANNLQGYKLVAINNELSLSRITGKITLEFETNFTPLVNSIEGFRLVLPPS